MNNDFTHFDPALLEFLRELSQNNDREWFRANKLRYEGLVLEPSLAFITTMSPYIRQISRYFEAVPKRIGGSLMRVYRDTRFSKDKRPYKTNVGIQFRHTQGKDVHAPGLYLHIALDEVFVAAGAWHPEATALTRIRERIVEHPTAWRKARDHKPFCTLFELSGDKLKRPPRGFPTDHPHIEDLKRKDFIGVHRFDTQSLFEQDVCADVGGAFERCKPLMKFLCQAQNLRF